ncbi:MAG: hypothetical protein A2878_00655 [Candidatus Moranbacteria bacterium RIFCSPHIGHO2_01_FULL_54_31]|nr:MAG: hypothetical protein A2878_00655 [Candidatus Moranbacteria bacterium RIFCSPHIGHO2_01_FULL_54_31]
MKSLQKGLRKIETHLDFREKYIFSVNLFQGIQPLSRIEGFLFACSDQVRNMALIGGRWMRIDKKQFLRYNVRVYKGTGKRSRVFAVFKQS